MTTFLTTKKSPILFIRVAVDTIMTCLLCSKPLKENEEDFCETCIEFLKTKYPHDKNIERRLKCYKEILSELQEE